MGYYSGSGVTVSKTSRVCCVYNDWVPSWSVDGQNRGWYNRQVYVRYTETVTLKNGVAEPSSLTSAQTVDANGALVSETSQTATRIGDSNLFALETRTTSGALVT